LVKNHGFSNIEKCNKVILPNKIEFTFKLFVKKWQERLFFQFSKLTLYSKTFQLNYHFGGLGTLRRAFLNISLDVSVRNPHDQTHEHNIFTDECGRCGSDNLALGHVYYLMTVFMTQY
jgi:hypothetical protein